MVKLIIQFIIWDKIDHLKDRIWLKNPINEEYRNSENIICQHFSISCSGQKLPFLNFLFHCFFFSKIKKEKEKEKELQVEDKDKHIKQCQLISLYKK